MYYSRLNVLVDPDCIGSIAAAQGLRGKGHYDVENVQITLRDDRDAECFLNDFDCWQEPARRMNRLTFVEGTTRPQD